MKQYGLTAIGGLVAAIIWIVTLIFNFDLFESLVVLLSSLERYETDEFIIPLTIFFTFSYLDLVRRHKDQKVEREKIKIYDAMLVSTHHILNNFLNQMQLFKLTAESTPQFDPKVLQLYEVIIDDAKSQLNLLANIADVNEASIHDYMNSKVGQNPLDS